MLMCRTGSISNVVAVEFIFLAEHSVTIHFYRRFSLPPVPYGEWEAKVSMSFVWSSLVSRTSKWVALA